MNGIRTTNSILIRIGIIVILGLVAGGLHLRKARDNPWKILIPFYGQYCLYRIASAGGVFWGTIVVSILSSVISNNVLLNIRRNTSFMERPDTTPLMIILIITGLIILIMQAYFAYKLAASFGKGKVFAIGLLFLFPIFGMILGCGNAVYNNQSG